MTSLGKDLFPELLVLNGYILKFRFNISEIIMVLNNTPRICSNYPIPLNIIPNINITNVSGT